MEELSCLYTLLSGATSLSQTTVDYESFELKDFVKSYVCDLCIVGAPDSYLS